MVRRIYFYRVPRSYIRAVEEKVSGFNTSDWMKSIEHLNFLLGTSIKIPHNNAGINLKKLDFLVINDILPIVEWGS